MSVGVERRGGGGLFQHRGFGGVQGFHVLVVGYELVFVHAAQHVVRPVVGDLLIIGGVALAGIIIPAGIIIVGVPRHARQHGAFPQTQVVQVVFAEIVVGGHLHAVIVLAQVNGVQVGFQDFVFCVPGFQLHGQIGFLNFALVGLLAGQQRVLDQLLGDGGATLLPAGDEIADERADDALDVDAVVGVKPRVLHRHKGVAQLHGHRVDTYHDAVFRALVVGDQVALRVIDERGLGLLVDGGQVQGRRGFHIRLRHADHRAQPRQHKNQRQQDQGTESVHRHRQNKGRLAGAGLKNGMLGKLLLVLVILVLPQPFAGEALVFRRDIGGRNIRDVFAVGFFRGIVVLLLLGQSFLIKAVIRRICFFSGSAVHRIFRYQTAVGRIRFSPVFFHRVSP